MKEKNQMSIGTDKKIEVSTSYLPMFRNGITRFAKILLFIAIILFLNIGSKYPAMSETSASTSTSTSTAIESMVAKTEYDKYVQMYQEVYQRSLIQQIEFESEVIIPKYFDFKYVEYAYNLSRQLQLSTRTVFRLMFKESSFIATIKSPMGAQGLMQLMPKTRDLYRISLCTDTLNLDENEEDIYIGLNMLKSQHEYWEARGNSDKYSWRLSLATYNAGIVPVKFYQGIPPIKETLDFLAFILKPHSNPAFYANIVKKNEKKELS